jgi:selenocysteine-specific elongation factor
MRRLILGTAGHIDHGKTTLVRALTGVDTDRLAEERRRGITIDLGFAHLQLADGLELGIVDVPGHEAFIRNMLAGATGIDLALLVIAADEGVMPQTREHLAILELLGVRGGVVALSKADLVEAEWLELVSAEVAEALQGTSFADAPLVPVSAATGEGLDTLRQQLATAATAIAVRNDDDLFRLPVDRVFPVHGTGTVITGTIWSGMIERDRILRLLPAGLSARVRAIQVHGKEASRAGAGQRAALGLVGIDRDRIQRGDILVEDAAWGSTMILTTQLRLLESAPAPLRTRRRIRFHLGTTEVMARIALLDRPELEPGALGWAQLRLEAPVVARGGDRFVIRSYSPVTTIGGGVIVEPLPAKRKRVGEGEVAHFQTLLSGTIDEGVVTLTRGAEWGGIPVGRLPIEGPFAPRDVAGAIERLEGSALVRVKTNLYPAAAVAAARERFLAAVDAYHTASPLYHGIDREELRRALPATATPALGEWVLGRLEAEGVLVARGSLVARTEFRPQLNTHQYQIRELLLQMLAAGGLAPPPLTALPAKIRDYPELRQLLRLLEGEDAVVALTPELYISRAHCDQAIRAAQHLLAGRGPLSAADFREAIPVSRKYLIPLLEHFDRTGITQRSGDTRRLS